MSLSQIVFLVVAITALLSQFYAMRKGEFTYRGARVSRREKPAMFYLGTSWGILGAGVFLWLALRHD